MSVQVEESGDDVLAFGDGKGLGAGAIRLLGPPGLVDPGTIAEAVLDLESNPAARAEMCARAATVCDGLGATRVMEALAA